MRERTLTSTSDGAVVVTQVGEGLWQGLRYAVAALASAVAFAVPPTVLVVGGLILLILRLILGLLFGQYASILEALAGVLVIPIILTLLALVALVFILTLALGVGVLALTPAAVVARLATGGNRQGVSGLATGALLLLAGAVAGVLAGALMFRLTGWLWLGPGLSLGWGLRFYVLGLMLGLIAALVYVLALLVTNAVRHLSQSLLRWAREASPPSAARAVLPAQPPLPAAGVGPL